MYGTLLPVTSLRHVIDERLRRQNEGSVVVDVTDSVQTPRPRSRSFSRQAILDLFRVGRSKTTSAASSSAEGTTMQPAATASTVVPVDSMTAPRTGNKRQMQTQRLARPRSNSEVVVAQLRQLHVATDTAPAEPTSSATSSPSADSDSTPMSQLLSGKTTHIGPDEFVELFYRTTLYDTPRRRHSDVQSASLWMSHAATTDHAHSSASSPSTSSPPKTLVVPPVIPENREVSSVSGRQHQRRSSSSSSPVSVCVRSRPTSVGVPVPANETSARRTGWSERTRSGTDRRRSVPAVITADRQTVVDQLRITNMLSNFPKVNTLHQTASSTGDVSSAEHVIMWRDQLSGTRVFSLPEYSDCDYYEQGVDHHDDDDDATFIASLLTRHRCYDLMHNSSKLIIFDVRLEVICAMYALLYNGVKAAPIWDAQTHNFIGMLTVSDFIRVLQYFYSSEKDFDDVERQTIQDWRLLLSDETCRLVSVDVEQSLHDAVNCLRHSGVHRLLVVDYVTGNPLYVLTYKRLLRFLHQFLKQVQSVGRPSFISKSIDELNVGTYDDLLVVSLKSPLIDALNDMMARRVSSLPVVDDRGLLVDIYTKFDVINLARDQVYSTLDCTIGEALGVERQSFEGVCTCNKSDCLGLVIDTLVTADVHRLIVVDDARRVEGVVSLSDVVHFLVSPTNTLTL